MTKTELKNSFKQQVLNACALRGLNVDPSDIEYLVQHLCICYTMGYSEDRIARELRKILTVVGN